MTTEHEFDGLNRHQRRAVRRMARLEREYEANPEAVVRNARIVKKFSSMDTQLRKNLGLDTRGRKAAAMDPIDTLRKEAQPCTDTDTISA